MPVHISARSILRLERLEGRETPGNLTVAYARGSHTLMVLGNSASNDLLVNGNPADPTQLFLASATDTFNGVAGPFTTPAGVRNVAISLLGGNDTVELGNGVPVQLAGGVAIAGGDGDNNVFVTNMKIGGGLAITNGDGKDQASLTNLSVGRSVVIRNGDGGSSVGFQRNSAGVSTVAGSVIVTNGAGEDFTTLTDLNVGGGVAIRNGAADAGGSAGGVEIFNIWNTGFRSQIRGGVLISVPDGKGIAGTVVVGDVEVGGGMRIAYGPGAFTTTISALGTTQPVMVHGGLAITGTGTNNLTLRDVEVGGPTLIRPGDGNNVITIDDSEFFRAFALTTGAGIDTIRLDTLTGTLGATTFKGPVIIREGAGLDTLTLAGTADSRQALVFLSTFVIHHGTEAEVFDPNPTHVFFPFGTALKYLE